MATDRNGGRRLLRNRRREQPREGTLAAEVDALKGTGDRKEIQRADSEVKEVVSKATATDLRNILLIDQGRCPVCAARTSNYLFTVVCPSCGWFKREIPSKGNALVTLRSGETIECDYVHHGSREEYLCIRDGVVLTELMRSEIARIDYRWAPGELEEAAAQLQRLRAGICSWCEADLSESPAENHREDYVAFGAFQEHYVFCSEKCQRSFRRHNPARVHRNCYEVDCNQCELCVKRYDTRGFKRNITR